MENCCVRNYLGKLLAASRNYTVTDFAALKMCVFSVGALFGMMVAGCKKCSAVFRSLFIAMAAVSFFYIMHKTFNEYLETEE